MKWGDMPNSPFPTNPSTPQIQDQSDLVLMDAKTRAPGHRLQSGAFSAWGPSLCPASSMVLPRL